MNNEYWIFLSLIFILVGTASNDFVIAHNNGKMPVKDFVGENKYIITALHQPLTEETNYPYLSDIFFGFSIGDILRLIGIIPFFIVANKYKNYKTKEVEMK